MGQPCGEPPSPALQRSGLPWACATEAPRPLCATLPSPHDCNRKHTPNGQLTGWPEAVDVTFF